MLTVQHLDNGGQVFHPLSIAFVDVTATVSMGGVQTAVWQLANALQMAGHMVTVIGGTGTQRPLGVDSAVQVRTFDFTPREKFWRWGRRFQKQMERLSFARQARHTVTTATYDWLIVTKPFDFFWAKWLKPHGARCAFMSGGTDFFRGDQWLASFLDVFLACSYFNAWQIQKRYKCFPTVIFNGVDTTVFAPRPVCRQMMRDHLGIPAGAPVTVFAGRLVGLKGLRLAVEALTKPALVAVHAHLLIIGEGNAEATLRAQAAKLGVSPRVIFHPTVAHHDLPDYYAAADVGVFPSIADEAFGIAIAEAMACGLPVVASYVGGIPEVVGNEGSCGLLVPMGDATALATALAGLFGNPVQRQAMGNAASQRIQAHFTWQQSANRLLAALQASDARTGAAA